MWLAYSKTGEEVLTEGQQWAWIIFYIGLAECACILIFRLAFEIASENMVFKIQVDCFRQLLRMPCAFFDDPKHSSERLSTRLAADSANARWGMDYPLGYFFSTGTGFVIAVVVASIYGWRMAILTASSFPFILYLDHRLGVYLERVYNKDSKVLEAASRVAMESIDNIKTVRSLTMEKVVMKRFTDLISVSHNEYKRRAKIQAFVIAFTGSFFYFVYCLNYAYGAYLVVNGTMWPIHVYIVLFCIAEVMHASDYAIGYFPDYIKARYAIGLIFKLLNDKPPFNNLSQTGAKPRETTEVSLKEVEFRYPQRQNQTVLRDFSLLFPSGKTTALVGASGCGKSSTISLIERFYDPNSGLVLLGNTPVPNIQPKYLRSKLSLVSQEPVLFDRTIRENIIYGLENDNISHERIQQVLEQANIKNFIDTLPEGIETNIGERGTQLSGGQKQRIAISRALIRNPDILLLDEATSAMDSQNEAVINIL
ncbi:hypothetical protein WR25_23879 [Diploscapter pachys]|uniref:ABC transmembrane type-1 domain-containing protein n=1 Tax=Diploscapter pachys TaxID=2018661 RepID=A0A2A2JLA2_9BILA|nr:hypothetical protein WR25_23879 [Diploscapter pachys]